LVAAELSKFELDDRQQRAVVNYVGAGLAGLITTYLERPSSLDTDTLAAIGRQLANGAFRLGGVHPKHPAESEVALAPASPDGQHQVFDRMLSR